MNRRIVSQTYPVVISLLLVMLSACSTSDPVRVEQDFGNSVRQMVQAQIAHPEVAEAPSLIAPGILDGESAMNTLTAYRTLQTTNAGKSETSLFGSGR